MFTFGKVESLQVAQLRTTISAPVKEVLKHEGALVNKGDLLIQLDAREIELAVNVARAKYDRNQALLESIRTEFAMSQDLLVHYQNLNEFGDSRLGRAVDLHLKGMISDSNLDDARQNSSERAIVLQQYTARIADFPHRLAQQQATLDESSAHLQKALMDLDQTRIVAPFSGRVIKSDLAQGDRVIAGTRLIAIADYGELEVRASVPTEVGYLMRQKMQQGEQIIAHAEIDGRKLEFFLHRISADIKAGQSGIDVFFRDPTGEAIDIGRTLRLAVTLPEQRNVIAMPVHALHENQTVFKVEENRLKAVRFESAGDYMNEQGDFSTLIRSEQIQSGDQLMVSQLPRAITGLLVETIDTTGVSLPTGETVL